MDEIQEINAKIKTLIEARNYLLHQQPTDMVILHAVDEKIIALSTRASALMAGPPIPPLPPAIVAAIGAAVAKLENAIKASATATAILMAATELANAGAGA